MQVANFIIGGTEKAGTTSVFSYLAEHPDVVASRRKETNFFREPAGTLEAYAQQFPQQPAARVVMEASPAYLGEADTVAPRIHTLLPDVKLLFIVREPASRLLSSFNFHRARLNLPETLSFTEYVRLSLDYADAVLQGDDPAARGPLALEDWYLKVLLFGCYARSLERYYEYFPRSRVAVMFYDDLNADPRGFMQRLGAFLELDPAFWDDADLEPRNVTFSGRSRLLHRAALLVNDSLEPVLRGAPRVKSLATRLYKRVNQSREGYDGMLEQDRAALRSFYLPHNQQLAELLETPLPEAWDLPDQPLSAIR